MTRFRVLVQRIEQDETGEDIGVTLVELLAPGEVLARFAPAVVGEALGAAGGVAVTAGSELTEAVTRLTAVPDIDTEAEKPKRPRRTKAQIAADEAAARVAELPQEAPPAEVPQEAPAPEAAEVASPQAGQAATGTAPYNPFLN